MIRPNSLAKYKKGDQVTCEVVAVQENGIEVKIADSEMTAFVKRSDLSRDRSEQRPERFTVGQKVDAAVISVDKAARRINVSIKQLEISEEKQAVAQYGSSDSGASLGDIFKAAIKKRDDKDEATAKPKNKLRGFDVRIGRRGAIPGVFYFGRTPYGSQADRREMRARHPAAFNFLADGLCRAGFLK